MTFSKLIPVSDDAEVEETIKAWGTKWDPYNVSHDYYGGDGESYFHVSFQTAWSPPEPVYKALTTKYPKLDVLAHYYEPGMDLYGYLGTFIVNEPAARKLAAVAGTLASAAAGLEHGGPWDSKDLAEMLKDALKDQCMALSPGDGEAKAEEFLAGARREVRFEEDDDD